MNDEPSQEFADNALSLTTGAPRAPSTMRLPRALGLLGLLSVLTLTGCPTASTIVGGGGIGGTGIDSIGAITAFGSVFVNGIEYQVGTNTAITVGGVAGTQSSLAIGMVVHLSGQYSADGSQRIASTITYTPAVSGPAAGPCVTTSNVKSLTVLAQNVVVDANTVTGRTGAAFDCSTVQAGDALEISGLADASGTIHATRVEDKGSGGSTGPVVLRGTVSSIDTVQKTFVLGNQAVNYSSATNLPNAFANGTASTLDGLQVHVTGTLVNNVLVATGISIDSLTTPPANTEAEVEGYITTVQSATTFVVQSRTVIVDSSTVYTAPATAGSIVVGKQVHIHGFYDGAGNILARSFSIDD